MRRGARTAHRAVRSGAALHARLLLPVAKAALHDHDVRVAICVSKSAARAERRRRSGRAAVRLWRDESADSLRHVRQGQRVPGSDGDTSPAADVDDAYPSRYSAPPRGGHPRNAFWSCHGLSITGCDGAGHGRSTEGHRLVRPRAAAPMRRPGAPCREGAHLDGRVDRNAEVLEELLGSRLGAVELRQSSSSSGSMAMAG